MCKVTGGGKIKDVGVALMWGAHRQHCPMLGQQQKRAEAINPGTRFSAVTTGSNHSCGLLTDGTVQCWGNNEHGQADAPEGQFTAVTVGTEHSCGLRTDSTIQCWGNYRYRPWAKPMGQFTAVTTGSNHSCGLSTDSTIQCWGNNPMRTG